MNMALSRAVILLIISSLSLHHSALGDVGEARAFSDEDVGMAEIVPPDDTIEMEIDTDGKFKLTDNVKIDDVINTGGVTTGAKEDQIAEGGAADEGGDAKEEEGAEGAGEKVVEEEEEEEEVSNLIGIGQPTHQKFTVFIYNYYPHAVEYHWRNTGAGDDQDWGEVQSQKAKTFSTFQGHEWYCTHPETGEELHNIFMTEEVTNYVFEPIEVRQQRDTELEKEKSEYRKEYKAKTGKNWLQVYPRDPVAFHMWDAGEIGRKQYAETDASLWRNLTSTDCVDEECDATKVRPEPEGFQIEIETLSVEPQVFAIHNVMSEEEADLIIETVQGRMKRSTVKTEGIISPDRTSETAWVGHSQGPVFDNIFDRIADVLGVERPKLKNSHSAESLQVVHYDVGGQYKAHHDYLDPALHTDNHHVQRGNNRLATFLFYLALPEEGGETSFPKSKAGPPGEGIKVLLPKGSAVLFYSMMPDGNLDDLTLHAGTPVIKGEKYISNLWIWEPRFR